MGKKNFENDLDVKDFVPWHDSRKWEQEKYYPLPHSGEAKFGDTTLFNLGVVWGVYILDPDIEKDSPLFGDIKNVTHGMSMVYACNLADHLNEKINATSESSSTHG